MAKSNTTISSAIAATTKVKVVGYWAGHDSFGRRVEVAKSSTGKYWCRDYRFNGYGVGPSPWDLCEHFEGKEGRNDWGFSWVFGTIDPTYKYPRFKLPG